jgi:thymidine phosphorylase
MLEAPCTGYLADIDAERIGRAAVRLGAGRARKGEAVDPAVGFVLQAKVGDEVARGQALVEIHARSASDADAVREELLAAYTWSETATAPPSLLVGTVASKPPWSP